ncbi:MAG: diguanylate cyclase [Bryobacteraceae bacterium]|nr:diguanylate cyclase [Bryobacteraceae bacterium]
MSLAVWLSIATGWHCDDPWRLLAYFALGIAGSLVKVHLPGIEGTMSVSFLVIILAIAELSIGEAVLIGASSTLLQCLWKTKNKIRPIQVAFSVSGTGNAIAVACVATQALSAYLPHNILLQLSTAACVYFVFNTSPVAGIIALTGKRSFFGVWRECYFWSLPYFVLGAALVANLVYLKQVAGWQSFLMVVPLMYWVYHSYSLYLGRLEAEKTHVEDMAGLHLRTIESLALAIEAKDQTTHDHLRRVETYAVAIGQEMELPEEQIQALRAAALLHDIGKLAVPEHIIAKPGKLTPEEFEKMKIHPVVGAQILDKVGFPYPVVPIVRSHHEKWDGSGYPDGLKAEEIPVGARILSTVDCLDALASDRQYRRALPLDEAMAHVVRESGKAFDPRIVDILHRRYRELEQKAQSSPLRAQPLTVDVKVERGAEPDAGFEKTPDPAPAVDFRTAISAARQEAQLLLEMTADLGKSLSLVDTLSCLTERLKKIAPYDAIAIYLVRGDELVPEFVNGENFRLFSSLRVPMGEGLSGWVAENNKPIINGNPSVEPGYLKDPTKFSTLQSALSVPLEGPSGMVGVLSLYKAEADSFTNDHLRILLSIAHKMAHAIENALRYQKMESSATLDGLTGLPNAKSMFLQLDAELSRSKRQNTPLAVLVCDLDGFKAVNDRWGHLEGNRVLKLVADGFRQVCREYDYVARMGGDEFVLLFPGTTAEATALFASRLTEVAEAAGREVTGTDLLSISWGASYYGEDGHDAEALLAEADKRMYKYKHEHKKRRGIPSRGEPVSIPA